MARVLGIGGVFFKATDPVALAAWYAQTLGLEMQPWGGVAFDMPQIKAAQVFSPFKADTEYFKPSNNPYMINLMVDDLDGVLARAEAQGVKPVWREESALGRFAHILDPEGGKIELWEPQAAAAE